MDLRIIEIKKQLKIWQLVLCAVSPVKFWEKTKQRDWCVQKKKKTSRFLLEDGYS